MSNQGRQVVLSVENLRTYFFTRRGVSKAVDGVDFDIMEGEVVGLVGESGCGKSMTALSILKLIPYPAARIIGGRIIFKGEDILRKSQKEMREIRGKGISMILQDPLISLDPVFNIGSQVSEAFLKLSADDRRKRTAKSMVVDMLKRVKVPSPELRLKDYPHQFSGGMRQRVIAAMAIGCKPELLIADEPTTALDVTVQAQFLGLLRELITKLGMAVIYITHDLGVVAQICERVFVMYAGKIVESASVAEIFKEPYHPYTLGLIRSIPCIEEEREVLYQIEGQIPNINNLPEGCSFSPRCPQVTDICRKEYPPQRSLGKGRWVKCWLPRKTGNHE